MNLAVYILTTAVSELNWGVILSILIVPAFGAMTGALIYLFKLQTKMREEILAQKEKEIKELKDKQKAMQAELLEMEKRMLHSEAEVRSVQQSLQLMQASNHALPVPAWMKDRNGVVLFCNPAYETIFLRPRGYTLNDYVGATDESVWPDHIAKTFQRNDEYVIASGEILDTMENITGPDGQERPCRIIKFPRKAGALIVGVDGIALPSSLQPWMGSNVQTVAPRDETQPL